MPAKNKSTATDNDLIEEELDDVGVPFGTFELPGSEEDDNFEIDLSDPNVSGVMPEGIYPAYLNNVEKTTSQKGDPMWVWYITPLVSFSTNTLRLYTVLTPNAAWKLTETLEAFGLGKAGEKIKFNGNDAVNRLCHIEVSLEMYKGQLRPSVSRVLPHPDGIGKKYEPFSGVPDIGDNSDRPF